VTITTWAGNITFRPRRFLRPATVAQLRAIVAASDRLRALGTAHSFNRLADTDGDLVSAAGLPPTMDIDTAAGTVRVSAGVRYGELSQHLHSHGYALRNLASLPHISVAGAVSTGTHGSGARNGSLATAVTGLQIVTASGDLVEVTRDDERFPGCVVALGALGVVTAVTLEVVPTFEICQFVYEGVTRAAGLDALTGAYSVSLFTDWSGPGFTQAWFKCADGEMPDLDARAADVARHPIIELSAEACTQQLGVPGPWHERLPHFRLDFTPSAGEELQAEYFVARADAAEAFAALDPIADRIAEVLLISEIRTVAADDLWLSPAYGRDSLAIHFTWRPDSAAVTPVLDLIEERLAPLRVRPHWGKLFNRNPAAQYEKMPDFRRLMTAFDPDGKLRNDAVSALCGF
jgi:xylitol oxidase